MANRGVPALLTGAVLISFSAVFVRVAAVPPTVAGFYRMLLGGLCLAAIARARGERVFGGGKPLAFQLLAAALFTGDLTVWHRSIHLVGPGLATLLANFQVFVLTIVALLRPGGRVGRSRLVSVPLALFGLFLIVGVNWDALAAGERAGVTLGLTTALFYAGYILVLPAARRPPRSGARGNAFGDMAAITLLTCLFLCAEPALADLSLAIPDAATLAALVAYGVFCQAFGQLCLFKGRLLAPPSLTGLVILLQPVLAFVWDVLFFARPMLAREIAGAAVAVFAIRLGARR